MNKFFNLIAVVALTLGMFLMFALVAVSPASAASADGPSRGSVSDTVGPKLGSLQSRGSTHDTVGRKHPRKHHHH